uniref:Nitric oxide synthase n=1 Tax=Strigamia maritima TaxID=126957 RepID=T1IV07_STRMM
MTVITEGKNRLQQSGDRQSQQEKMVERRSAIAVKNISTKKIHDDTLHFKGKLPCCNQGLCLTAHKEQISLGTDQVDKEEVVQFLDEFYASINKKNTIEQEGRVQKVLESVNILNDYDLMPEELEFGARLAWRNAPTSLVRYDWENLQVLDQRHVRSALGTFTALCDHLKRTNNGGKIKSIVSVFPSDGCRVWNRSLVSYAAYRREDNTVIGNPDNLYLTQLCERLGWQGTGSLNDLLPIVVNESGRDPEMFDLPKELVLEVPLRHPKHACFEQLNIKWPAWTSRADQFLKIGGLQFPAAPLSHVQVSSDVADQMLINDPTLLKKVAEGLNLDTSVASTLWKEIALIELNSAILHSFRTAGVSILDHHSASDLFLSFFNKEQKLRGGCPGDWRKLVPTISSSILLIYHQEMLSYNLTPAFGSAAEAWKTHKWQNKPVDANGRAVKLSFRSVARCIRWLVRPTLKRSRVTVLYASETGRSESFAEKLATMFGSTFRAELKCMHDYDLSLLGQKEQLLLVVTSTFGNGGSPENGKKFFSRLKKVCSSLDGNNNNSMCAKEIQNLKFAVFGLGSSAYPDFCQFGYFCHDSLVKLGSEAILPVTTADELKGQDKAFIEWTRKLFPATCTAFGIDIGDKDAFTSSLESDLEWKAENRRLTAVNPNSAVKDVCTALSKIHNRPINLSDLLDREDLQAYRSSRKTTFVKLSSTLRHEPGDHVAIFPTNSKRLVRDLLARLNMLKDADSTFQIEKKVQDGWQPVNRIPACSLTMAFTNFLDISCCPDQQFLEELCKFTSDEADLKKLQLLATDEKEHDKWRNDKLPNLLDVLNEFPSLKPDCTFLLERLSILQPRLYSISNSLAFAPNEIHLTVGVVITSSKDGTHSNSGLCSNFLNDLPMGSKIPYFVRQAAHFHLPTNPSTPVMMIGAGTGVAPFRGFWQQRQIEKQKSNGKRVFGELMLYFGCRHPAADHLFYDETQLLFQRGVLSSIESAYSRWNTSHKIYVQNLLSRDGDQVLKHIRNGGHIYICGDAVMAADVRSVLEKILKTRSSITMQELKESERIHEDIFINVGKRSL